ncbi:TPA: hypothetical protein CPT87_02765 [Candidatus Gastranaerophilales bacterium HUM_5]|nr:MAG TPA: hypothetical protein CPT87_02765 [Candidatus Gastranaerophilales bacterium HUM_5]DAB13928.1 MAG TPA: hypothetical protein CPT97_09200 [Candidatus Gastranaerophilales bacterium HUM_17]
MKPWLCLYVSFRYILISFIFIFLVHVLFVLIWVNCVGMCMGIELEMELGNGEWIGVPNIPFPHTTHKPI